MTRVTVDTADGYGRMIDCRRSFNNNPGVDVKRLMKAENATAGDDEADAAPVRRAASIQFQFTPR